MKRMLIALVLGSMVWLTGCDRNQVVPEGNYAKARVITYSCAGTVLQFIDPNQDVGEDWSYVENIYPPYKLFDTRTVYKHMVTGFGVPRNREVVGDTLEFSFQQISAPPSPNCAMGGGPRTFISIITLKE